MNSEQLLSHVVTAAAADDLRRLLSFWERVAWPIPDDDFTPLHPHFDAVLHAARAIDALGEASMTRRQQLETARRLLLGMRQSDVTA